MSTPTDERATTRERSFAWEDPSVAERDQPAAMKRSNAAASASGWSSGVKL